MTQDNFEEFVRGALDDVPAVPREELWARIDEARRFQRNSRARSGVSGAVGRIRPRQWVAWSAALAAMLLIGIALGRVSMARQTGSTEQQVAQNNAAQLDAARQSDAPDAPGAPDGGRRAATTSAHNAAYTLAALEHLGRAEVLLTAVSSGSVDQQLVGWAKDMLTSTQLLLDSPAASDARMQHLLKDLELILAQIATATPNARTDAELDLIHHGIKETDVLPRLRASASANRARPVGT